jgi:transcriptional regulator with XRE-family HTH domain
MPQFVAHSEQHDKTACRYLRREVPAGAAYDARMKHKIRQMRQERGWTVEHLSDLVGMSRSYVSEIENHRKTVNNLRLGAFAKAFGVSPVDLIDDESVSADVLDHVQRLKRLSPEDRLAVIRHALALDPRADEGDH